MRVRMLERVEDQCGVRPESAPQSPFTRMPSTMSPVARNLLPGALVVALSCGCADTRISLEDLQDLESAAAVEKPARVDLTQLALTDSPPYQVGVGALPSNTADGRQAQGRAERL